MEDYEVKVEERVKENKKYLEIFKKSLIDAGLADKTIKRHMNNIYFYLNTYLVHYDVLAMQDGCRLIDDYLGDWFIRKCMWASKESINNNCSTFKKFYKCMFENGFVTKDDYEYVVYLIKEEKEDWLETLRQYDSGEWYGSSFFF